MIGYPPAGLGGAQYAIGAALVLYAAAGPLRSLQAIDLGSWCSRVKSAAPYAAGAVAAVTLAVTVQSAGPVLLHWTGNLAMIALIAIAAVKLLQAIISLAVWARSALLQAADRSAAYWMADALALVRASLT